MKKYNIIKRTEYVRPMRSLTEKELKTIKIGINVRVINPRNCYYNYVRMLKYRDLRFETLYYFLADLDVGMELDEIAPYYKTMKKYQKFLYRAVTKKQIEINDRELEKLQSYAYCNYGIIIEISKTDKTNLLLRGTGKHLDDIERELH